MNFAEKIVRLRKSLRMTQDDLANKVGVSRQAVYKWECGQSYPEALKLVALKELFGVSIDNLLDDSYEVEVSVRLPKSRAPRQEAETPAAVAAPAQAAVPVPTESPAASEVAPTAPAEVAAPVVPVSPAEAPTSPASAPAQTPAEEEEPQKKKGFFARLFGR